MIGGATRLAAVIGHPVSHSRSPRMHNAAYREVGLDWAYVALPVPPERLADALAGLPALGFAGVNVTIPHKEGAAALAASASPDVRRARSANTLLVRGGALHAETTDGPGVVDALRRVGAGHALAGEALVVGAGGAARAAALALLDAGAARVAVAARRPQAAAAAAEALAEAAGAGRAVAAGWPPPPGAPLVVHATPVGQAAGDDRVPLADDVLAAARVVCDLAYRADGSPTPLAAAAGAAGAAVVDGIDVLAAQGALAFTLMTGRPAPFDAMLAAARGA